MEPKGRILLKALCSTAPLSQEGPVGVINSSQLPQKSLHLLKAILKMGTTSDKESGRAGAGAELAQCSPSMHQVLSSIPNTAQTRCAGSVHAWEAGEADVQGHV